MPFNACQISNFETHVSVRTSHDKIHVYYIYIHTYIHVLHSYCRSFDVCVWVTAAIFLHIQSIHMCMYNWIQSIHMCMYDQTTHVNVRTKRCFINTDMCSVRIVARSAHTHVCLHETTHVYARKKHSFTYELNTCTKQHMRMYGRKKTKHTCFVRIVALSHSRKKIYNTPLSLLPTYFTHVAAPARSMRIHMYSIKTHIQ